MVSFVGAEIINCKSLILNFIFRKRQLFTYLKMSTVLQKKLIGNSEIVMENSFEIHGFAKALGFE